MIWRRATKPTEPGGSAPQWRARFNEVARIIRSQGQAAWIEERVAEFERALNDAENDHARLVELIVQLDPARTAADLKQTLRERRPGGTDDARTAALRRRDKATNELVNRRETLEQQVRTAVSDFELFAIQTVESRASGMGAGTDVEHQLVRLKEDLRALEIARAEIGAL